MTNRRPLTEHEERRCLDFLEMMGITHPDHRFLSERGFFSLYLSGLRPEEIGKHEHPDRVEFAQIVRLLSIAGADRLRELLRRQAEGENLHPESAAAEEEESSTPLFSSESENQSLPPRVLRQKPLLEDVEHPRHPSTGELMKDREKMNIPPTLRAKVRQKYQGPEPQHPARESSSSTPSPAPAASSGGGTKRSSSSSSQVHPTAKSDESPRSRILSPIRARMREQQQSGAGQSASTATEVKNESSSDASGRPRPVFHRDVKSIKPSEKARERLRQLECAQSTDEAIKLSKRYMKQNRFHDAYHILVDYLLSHSLDQKLLEQATDVVYEASRSNRERNMPPFNMLYECEEMAAILAKKLPNLRELREKGDERTKRLYYFVELVYKTWAGHARALLDYKFRQSNNQYIRRNWIDPLEFSCLLDIMKMAVRSRLPLDLIRWIYREIQKTFQIAMEVIPHQDKQSKFIGDMVRILASPTKDIIPDMTFDMYRQIVDAYIQEGDTQSALMFCKQALMIHRHDKDMLAKKAMLMGQGASEATR